MQRLFASHRGKEVLGLLMQRVGVARQPLGGVKDQDGQFAGQARPLGGEVPFLGAVIP